MSGSVALLQPSSVLMSVASVAIEAQVTAGIWVATWGHIGVQGPSCYWAHADLRGSIQASLLLMAMFVVLLQLG